MLIQSEWLDQKLILDYKGPFGYSDDIGANMQSGMDRDETLETYFSFENNVHMNDANN
ncbi:MAG: hypothetical protein H7281_02540 [Bacteriovorax sp.]|nr:hypothetical protein [Bacteriovorax sp.]